MARVLASQVVRRVHDVSLVCMPTTATISAFSLSCPRHTRVARLLLGLAAGREEGETGAVRGKG